LHRPSTGVKIDAIRSFSTVSKNSAPSLGYCNPSWCIIPMQNAPSLQPRYRQALMTRGTKRHSAVPKTLICAELTLELTSGNRLCHRSAAARFQLHHKIDRSYEVQGEA